LGNVDLKGKVVDTTGKGVPQAIVVLKASNLSDTTDGQGNFSLSDKSTTSVSEGLPVFSGGISASLQGDLLSIRLAAPSFIVVSIHSLDGNVVLTRREALEAGIHRIAIQPAKAGVYFCRINSGEDEAGMRLLSTGEHWTNVESRAGFPRSAGMASRASVAGDTLRVTKFGYEDHVTAIGNLVQSGVSIVLKAKAAPTEDTGTVVNGCPVKMEGWAQFAGTTGGGNATPQKVTSVDELRTLSKDTVPRVLILEGTYDLGASYLKVGSNKTFLGIGKNAVVKANVAGFSLRLSHNVILRNLTVQGGGDVGTEGGDAVTATQADRLWFDHLTITDGPDGILDLTQGTTGATVSWCKIYYASATQPHRYAMQFSSGSSLSSAVTDRGKLDITMHHNWFGDLVDQRMPRHLWGKGHIYSSFYNSPGNTYCIGGASWASLLVENNYFKDVNDPHRYQDDCPTYINAIGNIYDNVAGKKETGLFAGVFPGCVSGGADAVIPGAWTPPYKYTLTESKAVPDLVKRCAGPQ